MQFAQVLFLGVVELLKLIALAAELFFFGGGEVREMVAGFGVVGARRSCADAIATSAIAISATASSSAVARPLTLSLSLGEREIAIALGVGRLDRIVHLLGEQAFLFELAQEIDAVDVAIEFDVFDHRQILHELFVRPRSDAIHSAIAQKRSDEQSEHAGRPADPFSPRGGPVGVLQFFGAATVTISMVLCVSFASASVRGNTSSAFHARSSRISFWR